MYWLFKTEPEGFSIDDLATCPEQTSMWEGVRNYQARNFMRDQCKLGDKVFIYHSSCKEVGVAGIAEVVKESYPDPTQFDPESKYFDEKATQENPRWFHVDVKFVEKFPKVIPLSEIKNNPMISEIPLVKRHRLSVMPVNENEWQAILAMK
jgi:predicted RNA-binding protein with PUA-like domain